MIDTLLDYLSNSSAITIIVLVLLSGYFIFIIWLFVYRIMDLNKVLEIEKTSLDRLISSSTIDPLSKIGQCIDSNNIKKELLKACEITFIKDASNGLSWLSIVSSTAPFIGLFGTVVGILESFAKFSTTSKVSFNVIAPAISEALVATAAGILVAIFAYTFHQILSRKVYEFNIYLKTQSEILLARD
jgi:flagellar motor component MotA